MNTNDLPPAAKLAALIEAGRAANPDLEHGRDHLINGNRVCALGFACLGAGVARKDLVGASGYQLEDAGIPIVLRSRVMFKNDREGLSLDAICTALREGDLAKITA